MNDPVEVLRMECLKQAHMINMSRGGVEVEKTIKDAQLMYDWVSQNDRQMLAAR